MKMKDENLPTELLDRFNRDYLPVVNTANDSISLLQNRLNMSRSEVLKLLNMVNNEILLGGIVTAEKFNAYCVHILAGDV